MIPRILLKTVLSAVCAAAWAGPQLPVAPPALAPAASAKVVIVHNRRAYSGFNPNPDVIQSMMFQGLVAMAGKTDLRSALRSYLGTNDTIGIKVYSSPGQLAGTRPVVVRALLEALVNSGFSPNRIVVWDKRLMDLRQAHFDDLAREYGVRLAGSLDCGYDTNAPSYDTAFLGTLVYSDVEFGRTGRGVGRKSYLSKLLTKEITKIIQVTPLLNHNVAGVSGNLYGLALGSVDNTLRFENSERIAAGVPEIYSQLLADKVAFHIVDALICQYGGEDYVLYQYSTILNQLRFSTDPVALDVLSLDEIKRQRERNHFSTPNVKRDLYDNAALMELGVAEPRQIQTIWLELDKSSGAR